jgi:hypothetical protein
MNELWAALGVPLLLGLGGLFSWGIRSKLEENRAERGRLITERRGAYLKVLDPYIRIFTKKTLNNPKAQERILDDMQSPDYRRQLFELTFFGSDEVVRAYNELMQTLYHAPPEGSPKRSEAGHDLMRRWGSLLLEVRRDLGNRRTDLDEYEMLAGMITDIETLRQSGN